MSAPTSTTTPANTPTSDLRQKIAQDLIERLEQGTAPWQQPIKPGQIRSRPFNPVSGTTYRGINDLALSLQNRPDPRWMTYRQALSIGAQVRKGEKGTPVEYWKWEEERPLLDGKGKPLLDQDGTPKVDLVQLDRPVVKRFALFNGSQIDGLEPMVAPTLDFDPIERAEKALAESGLSITHQPQGSAFYRPGTDSIHLPPKEFFRDASHYYATALHEVGHATGHQSRLNRDLSGPFGSASYAREELRAEIASMMLGQTLGIGHDPDNHAAYVGHWIKELKENPQEIFSAARDAEVIHTWVTQPEKRQELHQRYGTTQAPELAQSQAKEKAMEQGQAKSESQAQDGQTQDRKAPSFDTAGRYYLDVTYREREQAKGLGARWDGKKKQWYATEKTAEALRQWWPKEQSPEQAQPPQQAEKQPEAPKAEVQPAPKAEYVAPEQTSTQEPRADRLYLAVPFDKKDQLKADHGIRWDALAQSWYAPEGADLRALAPYIPDGSKALASMEKPPVDLEFADALRANGLVIEGPPVMNGEWQRVPVQGDANGKKSGSYRGFSDGRPAGTINNFKTGSQVQWVSSGVHLTAQERAVITAHAAQIKADRAADLAAKQQQTARTAFGIWKNAPAWATPENSPYLAGKNVRGYGVKVSKNGDLLVPLRDTDGHLHNLQIVRPTVGTGPSKIFLENGKKTGLFHLIDPGKDIGSGPIIIAEGYATGATAHQATGLPVAVAFDSGNLQAVAEALRAKHPEQALIIAADNDHHLPLRNPPLPNAGLEKAAKAAEAIKGTTVIAPTFTKAEQAAKLTDWNDFAKSRGLNEVSNHLNAAVMKAVQQQQQRLIQQTQQARPALMPKGGIGLGMGFG